jgi:hypothetical protein
VDFADYNNLKKRKVKSEKRKVKNDAAASTIRFSLFTFDRVFH